MQEKDQNREIALRAAVDLALQNETDDATKVVSDAEAFHGFLVAEGGNP